MLYGNEFMESSQEHLGKGPLRCPFIDTETEAQAGASALWAPDEQVHLVGSPYATCPPLATGQELRQVLYTPRLTSPQPCPWVAIIPILQMKAELREVCSAP